MIWFFNDNSNLFMTIFISLESLMNLVIQAMNDFIWWGGNSVVAALNVFTIDWINLLIFNQRLTYLLYQVTGGKSRIRIL